MEVTSQGGLRPRGPVLLATIEVLINGLIVLSSCILLVVSVLAREQFVSAAQYMKLTATDFYVRTGSSILLYTPPFIGGLGALRLKNWGRWLLVLSNVVLVVVLVRQKLPAVLEFLKQNSVLALWGSNVLSIADAASLMWYVLIIIYFSRPKLNAHFD